MVDRAQIERMVFQAVDKVNEVLLDEQAVSKDSGVVLLGEGAVLDSMGFVNFAVALDETVAEATGLSFSVADELNAAAHGAASQVTLGGLVDLVLQAVRSKA